MKYEDYKLALPDILLTAVFGARLNESIVGSSARQKLATATTSGYLSGTGLAERFESLDTAGQYWMRSGVAGFAPDATSHFFLPERYTDPFGNVTEISFDSRDLYVESTKDARGNETRVVEFDFRVLAPRAVQDLNGNGTRAAFDILGMPVAIALESAGDSLAGLNAGLLNPPVAELVRYFGLQPYADQLPRDWLAQATTRFVYHFGQAVNANGDVIGWEERPAAACSIQRETHVAQLNGAKTDIQVAIEYSDGGGNVLVKKAQAEPNPNSTLQNPPLRWIASGKTILNNKGKPVKQYEPYFSDSEHQHRFDATESEREVGVTPIMYYDAPGRLVRTEMPDGTFSRVEFSPWHVKTFDQNDTVMESRWYADRGSPPPTATPPAIADRRAAWLAAHHANTPALAVLDSLGREVVAVAHNRTPDGAGAWQDDSHLTFTKLDAEGKPLWIRDARENLVMQYITPHKANNDPSDAIPSGAVPCYDIAGNLLFQHSIDAGDRWMLMDAAGKSMLTWDLNDKGSGSTVQKRVFHTEYDELHRPTKQWLKIDAAAPALVEAFDYCDTDRPSGAANLADAKERNLIGQAVRHWDPSGLSTVERIDLSGKPAHVTRTLITPDADSGDTGVLNWNIANRNNLLEAETFRQVTEYDALGRVTRLYNWHRDITFGANGAQQSTEGATNRVAVYEPEYNERGALVSEWLHVRATKTTGQNGRISFSEDAQRSQQAIKRITYNAKGQKLSLELGNGTLTQYDYDEKTFRLKQIQTTRPADTSGFPQRHSNLQDAGIIQQLHYIYDPVGNITEIYDEAYKPVFFANVMVEPRSRYEYDALYRLISATGRENSIPTDAPRQFDRQEEVDFPVQDGNALRNYTQRYQYDSVGNIQQMRHVVTSATGSWTRDYAYAFDDPTQPASNRLWQTWTGGDRTQAITYGYDTHGNMLNLANVAPGQLLQWDHRDMILGLDLGGGGLARYHYGIDKQRTRKRIARRGGTVEDRIYLGGYELYRRRNARGVAVEEIESQHLFEGEQRVLLVDDVIISGGTADPRPDGLSVKEQTLFRYQYGNHLGSACLELDHQAGIISYEEYHPYGTSAYRAMKSGIEAPPKWYRYTGMERDEESGLSYHGARYYAPWIARWASCDPEGIRDGVDVYQYAQSNPVQLVDNHGTQATASRATLLGDDELPRSFLSSGSFSASLLADPLPALSPAPPPTGQDPLRAEASVIATWILDRYGEVERSPAAAAKAWVGAGIDAIGEWFSPSKFKGNRMESATENAARFLGFGRETSRWLAGRDLVSADKVQSEWKQNTFAGALRFAPLASRAKGMLAESSASPELLAWGKAWDARRAAFVATTDAMQGAAGTSNQLGAQGIAAATPLYGQGLLREVSVGNARRIDFAVPLGQSGPEWEIKLQQPAGLATNTRVKGELDRDLLRIRNYLSTNTSREVGWVSWRGFGTPSAAKMAAKAEAGGIIVVDAPALANEIRWTVK